MLFAVGGVDGELYVNGRPLNGEWAEKLRGQVPEPASDVDRLRATRTQWLDSPAENRTLALGGACADPNLPRPH
ncbi:hypothetical protein [Streptomyces sp. NPDC001787]|uniref:hypothetical protein n=1 Tax=Streptomyces sp. NPDC001787 TaxID=3154523 RepID=UPI00332F60BD